jgi:hypothetical protein
MRHGIPLLALSVVIGCAGDRITSGTDVPGPLPPGPGPLAQVWGMVVDENGACIPNASVRVVQGQALDSSAQQAVPCDVSAGYGGFVLSNLTAGLSMTIRATAAGYLSLDKVITPSLGPQPVVLFAPRKE